MSTSRKLRSNCFHLATTLAPVASTASKLASSTATTVTAAVVHVHFLRIQMKMSFKKLEFMWLPFDERVVKVCLNFASRN